MMVYNNRGLKNLMRQNVNGQMVRYLSDVAMNVLPVITQEDNEKLPTVYDFVWKLVNYTRVHTPTLLCTVVYLNRLRKKLPEDASGLPSTTHRILLACLILSAKNHNDSSPLNKHWTKYTDGLFTLQDLNLMERQLLAILDWNTRITESELIIELDDLITSEHLKYKVERNVSISSNISSTSTLVGSTQNLQKIMQISPTENINQLMPINSF